MNRNYGMQVVMKDLSQFSQVYLVPFADFHEGARDADHEVSTGYINWVKERDNAFTILNGDMMNCAFKESTPELYEDLITPDTAYAQLRERLMPIKDKILMITRGGHEEHIFRKVGVDFMARLAYDLGDIPYRPDGGMLGLRMAKNDNAKFFYIYATHGWGGARTIGAKVKKVDDLMMVADADVYVLSHDHTQNIHRANIFEPPRSKPTTKRPCYMTIGRRLLINTGGFIRYSGYIQRKGYVPTDLGTPRVRLEIKKNGKTDTYEKDLHASV